MTFTIAGINGVTGANGVVFIGAVPIGTYDIAVSGVPSGYAYDPADVTGKVVVADDLTTVVVNFGRPSTVNYTITDSVTHNVIPNVAVTLVNSDGKTVGTAHTAADGVATFTGLLIGTYSVQFDANGYNSATQPLSITQEDSTQNIPVSLAPKPTTGSVAVTVKDSNGTILQNATVVLRNSSTGVQTTLQTASNGVATFANMPPGDYTVHCSMAGYSSPADSSLTLNAGDALSLTVILSGSSDTGLDIATYKQGLLGGILLTPGIRVIVSGPGYYNDSLTSSFSLIGLLFPSHIRITGLLPGTYTVQTYTKPLSVVTVIVTGGHISNCSVVQKW